MSDRLTISERTKLILWLKDCKVRERCLLHTLSYHEFGKGCTTAGNELLMIETQMPRATFFRTLKSLYSQGYIYDCEEHYKCRGINWSKISNETQNPQLRKKYGSQKVSKSGVSDTMENLVDSQSHPDTDESHSDTECQSHPDTKQSHPDTKQSHPDTKQSHPDTVKREKKRKLETGGRNGKRGGALPPRENQEQRRGLSESFKEESREHRVCSLIEKIFEIRPPKEHQLGTARIKFLQLLEQTGDASDEEIISALKTWKKFLDQTTWGILLTNGFLRQVRMIVKLRYEPEPDPELEEEQLQRERDQKLCQALQELSETLGLPRSHDLGYLLHEFRNLRTKLHSVYREQELAIPNQRQLFRDLERAIPRTFAQRLSLNQIITNAFDTLHSELMESLREVLEERSDQLFSIVISILNDLKFRRVSELKFVEFTEKLPDNYLRKRVESLVGECTDADVATIRKELSERAYHTQRSAEELEKRIAEMMAQPEETTNN